MNIKTTSRFQQTSIRPLHSSAAKLLMKNLSQATTIGVCVALLLSGCSALPSSQNEVLGRKIDLGPMHSAIVDGSARMFEGQHLLREQVEQKREIPLPAAPAAPDPLQAKKISMSMQDARIGQLLWVLAGEFGLSLSIQPSVLSMTQVANLHLQNVTGREALNLILEVFDVDGQLADGRILRVSQQQEKVFSLDALTGKSFIDLSVGGDLFGSGSSKGSQSLKDALTLGGEFGERGDGFEQLTKTVEALLSDNGTGREKARFGLDRSGGMLYVKASPSRIAAVEALLSKGMKYRQRQVQIEAQLVDVQLSEGSQLGIDWTLLNNRVAGRLGAEPATALGASGPLGNFRLGDRSLTIPAQQIGLPGGGGVLLTGRTFTAALNALQTFGTVKVLSNPTIRVRNGTPAVLTVGTSSRYVQKITSNQMQNGSGTSTSNDVQTDSVFSGVVVGVSAVIKSDGSVELFIRPSQTEVQERSLALIDVGQGSKVTLPVINTKSITTTLNMLNGETVIIGGLISQQVGNGGSGLPGLSQMSGFESIFGSKNDLSSARELVVILRLRVIE